MDSNKSIKKIGENETGKIFGWVKKIIDNVSAKIKGQHKENYSYLGEKFLWNKTKERMHNFSPLHGI